MALPISEADLQQQIIDLARLLGYRVAHFRPALTGRGWRTPVQADGAGFPDLILVHPERGRLVVIECKGERGRITPAQQEWLEAFRSVPGCTVYVARPDDMDNLVNLLR